MTWQPLSTYPHSTKPWDSWPDVPTVLLCSAQGEIRLGHANYDIDWDDGHPIHDGWRRDGEGFEFHPIAWQPLPPPITEPP